jgi:hypothetical protein
MTTGLFLLTFAGLIFLLAFSDRVFFTSLEPQQSVVTVHRVIPPDYDDAGAWAALPGRDDFADLLPTGVEAAPEDTRSADVFFVHTTTHIGHTAWTAAISEPLAAQRVDEGSIKHQATAFSECCRIFAPRYRQASDQASKHATGNDSRRALDTAYQDVEAAFNAYLENWGQDARPLILAGHGQGARHVLRLLEQKIAGTPLQTRLVAAYVVGLGLPFDHISETVQSIPVCTGPETTGCLLGWTAMAEDADDDLYATQSLRHPSGYYQANANRARLCVNPLSWDVNDTAVPAAENPGGVPFVEGLGPLAKPIPALTGATCTGGTLRINEENASAFSHASGNRGDFHLHDYNLFYMSVRRNATMRVEAFLAAQPSDPTPENVAN